MVADPEAGSGVSLRVTVVIPCRNDADYLEACLRALATQTRPADRIVVVDNDSHDTTVEVARRHGAEVLSEPVVGIWPAAARGYDAARESSDIIARIDADSRPRPDWIARLVAEFAADDALGVLTGGAEFYGAGRLTCYLGEHWYIGGGRVWIGLWLGRPLIFGSNFAMRTRVWERVRLLVARTSPRIHDDLDLTIRLRASDGIRWDRTLRMPVSARPFSSVRGFLRRILWVPATFAESWPEGSPRRARREALPRGTTEDDGLEPEYGR